MKKYFNFIKLIFLLIIVFNLNLIASVNYSKLYNILNKNEVNLTKYKVLLIIPAPSCHGCFTILKNNLDKFVKNKDLKIVNLIISEKLGYSKLITEIDYYENYKNFNEVFGITAYILNKGIIVKEIPIVPDNINKFIKIISKNTLSSKDIINLEKINNNK
jgi:hypothetical protein